MGISTHIHKLLHKEGMYCNMQKTNQPLQKDNFTKNLTTCHHRSAILFSQRGFFDHHGVIFFVFYQNMIRFKKNYKFGQVVPIWYDFICTTRPNLTRLCHVIFCHLIIFYFFLILLFIYWVVSYVMLKINLMHNFLKVLVLRNKKLDNRVWIMFDGNVIQ